MLRLCISWLVALAVFLVSVSPVSSQTHVGQASIYTSGSFQNVGIGTSTPDNPIDIASTASSVKMSRWSNTAAQGAGIVIQRSRGASVDADTVIVSGDKLSTLNFRGYDGSNFITAAQIQVFVDGVPGDVDMPGRIMFLTTADGASVATERMRIDSAGNVGIGSTSPTRAKLVVLGSVSFDNGSYGFLEVGGTTGTASGAVNTSIFADNRVVANEINANSDRRVKENIHPYNGASKVISSLRVVGYNKLSKSGNAMGELGLIGQELVESFPLALRVSVGDVPDGNGGWTEVDDFHTVNYQSVLMLAVRAIQEQGERIDELSAEVERLHDRYDDLALSVKTMTASVR